MDKEARMKKIIINILYIIVYVTLNLVLLHFEVNGIIFMFVGSLLTALFIFTLMEVSE